MNLTYKPNIDDVLKRYQAFWQKSLDDRPPIRIRYPIQGQNDEDWPTVCQHAETYYPYWENLYQQRVELLDDDVCAAAPDLGPGFMGGVMGCELVFGHGTSWSEHCLQDWAGLDTFRHVAFDERNPWLERLNSMIQTFASKGNGKCAPGIAMLTGPGDIMTALRGPTPICMDFYAAPEQIRQLAEICAKAWIAVEQLQFDWVTPFAGGYCDNYSIWTPGRSGYFADDISTLLSPDIYRKFLFEFDCRVAASLETPWIHAHSGGIHIVPEFLNIPGLVGVQIVNDSPAGPSLKKILPMLQQIQKRHCLLLRKYPMDELDDIVSELSPEGFYIDTQCESLEEAQHILQRWNQRRW